MKNEKLIERLQSLIEKNIDYSVQSQNLIYEPIRYILEAGGKRIRPIITILAAQSVGGNVKNSLNIAVAIEFFHTFTLIHDDIMDNSDRRRGLKTIHKMWDQNTAILSGDFLSGLSYKKILETTNEHLLEILKVFTNAYLAVCDGQNEDLILAKKNSVSMDEYLKMIKKKTAILISAAAEIGALAAGGKKSEIKALREYGLNLGMAFQIKDDLLDVLGEKRRLGKPLYQDIYEGKKTYLYIKALELAKGKELKTLKQLSVKQKINREFVNQIKKIYFQLGVIEAAQSEVARYANIAKRKLNVLKSSEAKNQLLLLTDKITSRSY